MTWPPNLLATSGWLPLEHTQIIASASELNGYVRDLNLNMNLNQNPIPDDPKKAYHGSGSRIY